MESYRKNELSSENTALLHSASPSEAFPSPDMKKLPIVSCIFFLASVLIVLFFVVMSKRAKKNNEPPATLAAVTDEDKEVLKEVAIHLVDNNTPPPAVANNVEKTSTANTANHQQYASSSFEQSQFVRDKNNDNIDENVVPSATTLDENIELANERFENPYATPWSVSRARKAIISSNPVRDLFTEQYTLSQSYGWADSAYATYAESALPNNVNAVGNNNNDENKAPKAIEENAWKNDSEEFGRCSLNAMNDLRVVLDLLYAYTEMLTKTKDDDDDDDATTTNERDSSGDNATDPEQLSEEILRKLRDVESYITAVTEHMRETVSVSDGEYTNKWTNGWTNWFQVSITHPALLAYYLLVPHKIRKIETSFVLKEINAIISTPYLSLGYKRDGPNAVAMFGPWLIAQIYKCDCDELEFKTRIVDQDRVYSLIMDELKLVVQTEQFAKGWHRDASFIAHETCLGFGYLQMMCSSYTFYAYELDSNMETTPYDKWNELATIVLHPSIDVGPPGLLGRDSSFSSRSHPDATYGCEIMQLGRIFRVNGTDSRFIARGVHAGLGYFEADKLNDGYAQYWVQARAPYGKNTDVRIPPLERAYGIVFSDGDADYRRLPSRTSTTDIYYPDKMSTCYVGVSATEEFLVQRYRIDEFGDYVVAELIRHSNKRPDSVLVFTEYDNRKGTKDLYVRLSENPIDAYALTDEEARKELTKYTIKVGELLAVQHTINVVDNTIFSEIHQPGGIYEYRSPMWDKGDQILLHDGWFLNLERNVVTSTLYGGDYSSVGPRNGEPETDTLTLSDYDIAHKQYFEWDSDYRSYMIRKSDNAPLLPPM